MAESSIEWVSGPGDEPGYTFNPVRGCMKVSPECKNCYAEARDKLYEGGKHWGPNTPRVVRAEAGWREPLKWNAEAAAAGQRRKVFCASLADVMEDHPDWEGPRARLFGLIRVTPNLDWLLLTKRPENFARFLPWAAHAGGRHVAWNEPWFNVWGGVTAGTQAMADLRIPVLQQTPFAVRFVSVEPQLEHVSLMKAIITGAALDWVICGGESGHGARTFDVDWARRLRDQCASLGVAFFMKQLGARTRMSHDGGDPLPFFFKKDQSADLSFMPEDLRIRQWPEVLHA